MNRTWRMKIIQEDYEMIIIYNIFQGNFIKIFKYIKFITYKIYLYENGFPLLYMAYRVCFRINKIAYFRTNFVMPLKRLKKGIINWWFFAEFCLPASKKKSFSLFISQNFYIVILGIMHWSPSYADLVLGIMHWTPSYAELILGIMHWTPSYADLILGIMHWSPSYPDLILGIMHWTTSYADLIHGIMHWTPSYSDLLIHLISL